MADHAYAPYSGLRAWAPWPSARRAAATDGVNVENAAYPAGLCAERAALAALVTPASASCATSPWRPGTARDCLPCGMCLQALSEFGDPDLVVRRGGQVVVLRLSDLLAAPFSLPREDADA